VGRVSSGVKTEWSVTLPRPVNCWLGWGIFELVSLLVGYRPHLFVGLGRLESAFACFVRLLREGTTGNRTHCLRVKVPKGSKYTGGPARSLACLVRLPREDTTVNRRRVSCGVQPLVWIKRCTSYQPLSLSVLRQHVSGVLRQYWILVCTGQDQVVMVVIISDHRTYCL